MRTRVTAVLALICDALQWLRLTARSSRSIKAEDVFLRRQRTLYNERGVKPRRVDPVARCRAVLRCRLFDWRDDWVIVRRKTLLRWHHSAWKLRWRLKSRPARAVIPVALRRLIRRIALENLLWGEERLANKLRLKGSLKISSRSVRKDRPWHAPGRLRGRLRGSTFLRLHARGIPAGDLCLTRTANFRTLYVFGVIKQGNRRVLHCSGTAHSRLAGPLQPLRDAVGLDQRCQFLLHDRDGIFCRALDGSIKTLGISGLRSAPYYPKINARGERVIGTRRRGYLNWPEPRSESPRAHSLASRDPALQPRPSVYAGGCRHSRPVAYRPGDVLLTTRSRRVLCGASPTDPRYSAARIPPRRCWTHLLRSPVFTGYGLSLTKSF